MPTVIFKVRLCYHRGKPFAKQFLRRCTYSIVHGNEVLSGMAQKKQKFRLSLFFEFSYSILGPQTTQYFHQHLHAYFFYLF